MPVADNSPAARGQTFIKDGKPVAFRAFDPQRLAVDADTFQFRRQVNKAGTTGRLSGVAKWDPMASGKVVVFERVSGEQVIADGHHRLELAKRLADQQPELQGYLFREADGWTPAEVRAYAAKKNMIDSPRVDPVDAARVLRERPDLIDGSVPVGDETIRQARALSKLSDDGFGMVVGGVIPPNYASLVGDLVPDKSRHASMLAEMAEAAPANVREARYLVGDLLHLPVREDVQFTLFGAGRVERSILKERSKVLDQALRALRDDKKVFAMLDREAGRIEEAGNQLDEAANAARAAEAETVSGLIEQLALNRGPVSSWLSEAALSVTQGIPATQAAKAFARRVADALERDGLKALIAEQQTLRANGFDEPGGPEARLQVERLEDEFAEDIERALKPELHDERQAALFAIPAELKTERRLPDPTSFARITKRYAERRIEELMSVAETLARDGQMGRASSIEQVAKQYKDLLPKFDEDLPRGKPFDRSKVMRSGDFVVRLTTDERHGADASTKVFRIYHGTDADIAALRQPSRQLGASLGDVSISLRPDGRWEVDMVEIKPRHRGKGVAKALYAAVEKEIGIEMRPSGILLPDGYAMWKRRSPELVKYHAEVDGVFYSPRRMMEMARYYREKEQFWKNRAAREEAEQFATNNASMAEAFEQFATNNASMAEAFEQAFAKVPDEGKLPDVMNTMFALRSAPYAHTPAAAKLMPEIRAELLKTVDMLPRDVRMRVVDKLVFADGQRADGLWDGADRLIYVALSAGDPVRTSRHEVVHALRQSNLLSDGEFDTLYNFAEKLGLRQAYGIDKTYKAAYSKAYGHRGEAYVESLLREETIANMFSDYSLNGRRFGDLAGGGVVDKIIDAIVRFMERLRNGIEGFGFRDVRDVFEAIESGDVARRAMFANEMFEAERTGHARDLAEACKL
ncbi:MAG: hypothetical protein ACRCS9_08745 [Hyphomicrobium sp.]